MIYLLNHSKKAWDLVERRGRTNTIRKRFTSRQDSNTITIKQIELNLDKRVPVPKAVDLSKMTRKGNHLESIKPITKHSTSTFVSYDPINFSPVAIYSKRDDQPFLIISLPNVGNKLPHFTFGGGELLDYLSVEEEFSAVLRFKPGTSFGIALRRTKVYVNYVFKCDKQGIITVESEVLDESKLAVLPTRVTKFRPNIPTDLILVQKDDLKTFKRVMADRKSKKQYTVKTYTTSYDLKRSLKDTMKRYNAVTLFVDTEFRNESKADKTRYSITIDLLEQCNVVQKLHNNGKISRVRVM